MAEKKKFIDVELPILDKTIQVLGTVKDLEGKTIKLDLSRKLRGKGVLVTFQIFNREDKLIGLPKKMELMISYIRRIIRKRTDNVEDSFLVSTSDVRATLKPLLITRKKVSRAVRKNLRNTAREFLIGYARDRTYNEIVFEILEGVLQKNLLPKLKKVYPLAFCDIRVFETKDLEKIDISSVIDLGKEMAEEDTPEVEEEIEEKIEEEIISEAIEEAEEDKKEDLVVKEPKKRGRKKKDEIIEDKIDEKIEDAKEEMGGGEEDAVKE